MERITLMCVLLTAVVSSSPRQYHFVNQEKSWTEAQSYCRDKYTDLVTINDMNEHNEIKQLIQREKSNANRVWIGLKDAWIWSLSDPDFYRGDESQYRSWGSEQPDGDGDCVYMDNGQWHDRKCSDSVHFICYTASKGFVLESGQKNWTDAQKHCRQYHTDLASVRNQSENNQAQNIINQDLTSPQQAWIGLYRFWVWSDNTNFIFKHWKHGNPNIGAKKDSICTSIDITDHEGQWTDELCTEQRPFVCYDEMERITLMCVLLTAVVSSSPRQYHFMDQQKSWTEAQSYCRDKYTDLVTINDMNEQNKIKQLIYSNSGHVWIGLKSTNTWIWSLNDPAFYRRNESQYRSWGSGQPDGDGDCIYMENNGQWHDITCNHQNHFICYNASTGFVRVQEEKSWVDAQKYCRQYHTDLASVRNESENEQIKSIIEQIQPPKQAWIGLHRLWVWSDNSTSTFTYWETNKPDTRNGNNDHCALTDHQGRWTDELCTEQHPFVCYDDKLVLIRENKTWTEALRYCRNNNMDLVSVDSEQMQQRVMNVTASALTAHVWLGLRHSCTVGLWFWVNGHTMCYDQWAPNYDNGLDDCDITVRSGAIRTRDNLWISRPETDRNNFICIKGALESN